MTVYECYTLLLQIKMLKQHPVLQRMIGVTINDLTLAIEHAFCKKKEAKIHFDRILTVWMHDPNNYPLSEFALASYFANWQMADGMTQMLTEHYRKALCLKRPALFHRRWIWK